MRPVYLPVSLYLALSHMHTLLTYSITYPLSFLSSAWMAWLEHIDMLRAFAGKRQKHTKMSALVYALHAYEGSTKRVTFSRSPFATAGNARLMCLNGVRRASLPLHVCVAPLRLFRAAVVFRPDYVSQTSGRLACSCGILMAPLGPVNNVTTLCGHQVAALRRKCKE